jgi:hypothetical protein
LAAPGCAEHAGQHVRLSRGYTAPGQPGCPVVVGGDDAVDGASGEFGEDAGDVFEVERVRRGQWPGRATGPAFAGQDGRCRFGEVGVPVWARYRSAAAWPGMGANSESALAAW